MRKGNKVTGGVLGCIDELLALPDDDRVQLSVAVCNHFLRELLLMAERSGPLGLAAAEAAVGVLTLNCELLRLQAEKGGSGIAAVAKTSAQWPVLMSALPKDASAVVNSLRAKGVGSTAMIRIGSRSRATTAETKWVQNFVLRTFVCRHEGWLRASRDNGWPARWCKRLAALPDFDGTVGAFDEWESACWHDAKDRFPGELLKRHPDWQHLPGAKGGSSDSTVPESRIRARLKRALRQRLRVT